MKKTPLNFGNKIWNFSLKLTSTLSRVFFFFIFTTWAVIVKFFTHQFIIKSSHSCFFFDIAVSKFHSIFIRVFHHIRSLYKCANFISKFQEISENSWSTRMWNLSYACHVLFKLSEIEYRTVFKFMISIFISFEFFCVMKNFEIYCKIIEQQYTRHGSRFT